MCIRYRLDIDKLFSRSFKTNDSASFRYHTDKENLLQIIYMMIAGYFEDDASDEQMCIRDRVKVPDSESYAYKLVIPNKEVREVFILQIQEWFKACLLYTSRCV